MTIDRKMIDLRSKLELWIKKHSKSLTIHEKNFIEHGYNTATSISTFYQTIKIHKDPWSTRPIISCPGTLLYNLGKWVDATLQPIADTQPAYFKDSLALKNLLSEIDLPPYARLFSADAVSMYTNIKTTEALWEIGQYLHRNDRKFRGVPIDALMSALTLIMRNNMFQFGDTYWLQISGTAMGTPPAPPYANLYFAIHEARFVKKYSDNLLLYKRFIDDVIGIWIPSATKEEDATAWSNFSTDLNSYHGLQWTMTTRAKSLNFMDLTITLNGTNIDTTLYEKKLNIHQYITPGSAHPPGVLTGLIFGNSHRIYSLCSQHKERIRLPWL